MPFPNAHHSKSPPSAPEQRSSHQIDIGRSFKRNAQFILDVQNRHSMAKPCENDNR